MSFDLASFVKKFDPGAEKGKLLLLLNAAGMVFASASNTVAAATDKNTSAKDKKFLVPAGVATGVANIGLYYAMTTKIIDGLKEGAQKKVDGLNSKELSKRTLEYSNKCIEKAGKGLFKKAPEYIENMKNTLISKDGAPTQAAIQIFKDDNIAAAGVLGAFIGAVVGCSILTPIIRDVSAYFIQKKMEKNNPDLQSKPYRPYFDPIHIHKGPKKYQPLSMKSYMAFTNKSGMKI